VLPVIKGTTVTISESVRNSITGKHDIKELQETAPLGTAHILQEVLMSKYKKFFLTKKILHVRYVVATEYLQLIYTRNMGFRHVIVNNLYISNNSNKSLPVIFITLFYSTCEY
jgi:hypothetical protein